MPLEKTPAPQCLLFLLPEFRRSPLLCDTHCSYNVLSFSSFSPPEGISVQPWLFWTHRDNMPAYALSDGIKVQRTFFFFFFTITQSNGAKWLWTETIDPIKHFFFLSYLSQIFCYSDKLTHFEEQGLGPQGSCCQEGWSLSEPQGNPAWGKGVLTLKKPDKLKRSGS